MSLRLFFSRHLWWLEDQYLHLHHGWDRVHRTPLGRSLLCQVSLDEWIAKGKKESNFGSEMSSSGCSLKISLSLRLSSLGWCGGRTLWGFGHPHSGRHYWSGHRQGGSGSMEDLGCDLRSYQWYRCLWWLNLIQLVSVLLQSLGALSLVKIQTTGVLHSTPPLEALIFLLESTVWPWHANLQIVNLICYHEKRG